MGPYALPLPLAAFAKLCEPNSSPPKPELVVALLPSAVPRWAASWPHAMVCMRGGRRMPPPAAASAARPSSASASARRVSAGRMGVLMVRRTLGAGGGLGIRELAALPAVEAAQDGGPDPWVMPVPLPPRWGVPDQRAMSTDACGLLPPLLGMMSGKTTEPLGMSCRRLLARQSGSAMLGDSMA